MIYPLLLVAITFATLTARAWWSDTLHPRSSREWILDVTSLLSQGLLVPLVQVVLLTALLEFVWPGARASLDAPAWLAFLLSFTLIDYAYYWNHRGLHGRRFWFLHRVHHSIEKLDVLGTSRNSVWTPLTLIYLWSQAVLAYWLRDPSAFLLGVGVSNALDLWRHSGGQTSAVVRRLFGPILVLPEDHEWHHSAERHGVNFGANLNLWDRLHGTFHRPQDRATRLGVGSNAPTRTLLFAPWRISR